MNDEGDITLEFKCKQLKDAPQINNIIIKLGE